MLFYYIRHGDPIYDPDSLTYLGEKQAEALSKRLLVYGVDRIYASTSNRAIQTAMPTAKLLKKEIEQLDWANEGHAWRDFTVDGDWLIANAWVRRLFRSPEMLALGDRWYEHEALREHHYERGVRRIAAESDRFFLSLGYRHVPGTGVYEVVRPNEERVALFAHHGFGQAFLSHLLGIPYPVYTTHFALCTAGLTVLHFAEDNGYATPTVLTHSSDAHMYAESLPVPYDGGIRF